jgi:hypothetical protein
MRYALQRLPSRDYIRTLDRSVFLCQQQDAILNTKSVGGERAMDDPLIDLPLSGEDAFTNSSPIATWSRAAQLAGLAVQLAGKPELISELESEARYLRIPRVEIPERILSPEAIQQAVDASELSQFVSELERTHEFQEDLSERELALWQRADSGQDPLAAAALIYLSLFDPDETVRVAAAASYAAIVTRDGPRLWSPPGIESGGNTMSRGESNTNEAPPKRCE